MKLVKLLLPVALLFSVSAFAAEEEHASVGEEHHKELPYYVAVKGMYTLGDTYTNEAGIVEDGDAGYGIGIDLGYRLGHGFAVEIDGTYENGDVAAKEEGGEEVTESVKYYTTSLDFVYVYEVGAGFGILGKVGYEYEHEEVSDTTNNENDFIFAAGAEYEINEEFKAIAEYEHSLIDGPKGDAILAGIMYNF